MLVCWCVGVLVCWCVGVWRVASCGVVWRGAARRGAVRCVVVLCCRGVVVVLLWCCGGVLVLWWCCGGVVVSCCGVVVVIQFLVDRGTSTSDYRIQGDVETMSTVNSARKFPIFLYSSGKDTEQVSQKPGGSEEVQISTSERGVRMPTFSAHAEALAAYPSKQPESVSPRTVKWTSCGEKPAGTTRMHLPVIHTTCHDTRLAAPN